LNKARPFKIGTALIILVFVLLPLAFASRRIYKLIRAIRDERAMKQAVLILEAENEVRQRRLEEYRKGSILEAKARDDLGMIKEGEKVYLIKTGKDSQ